MKLVLTEQIETFQICVSEEQVRDRLVLRRQEGRAEQLQVDPQAQRGLRADRFAR